MNLRLPIKIAKKQVGSILDYFRNSGWNVEEKQTNGLTLYFTDAPGWGKLTPIVEVQGRNAWFYVRIDEAKKWQ
jgi:hypothetical protein